MKEYIIWYMVDRLKRACDNYTSAEGGLSLKELQKMVLLQRPGWPVHKMTRRSLLRQLCDKICPTNEYVGATDVIADIDVNEDGNFTYKGKEIDINFNRLGKGTYGEVLRASFVSEGQTLHFAMKRDIRGIELDEALVVEEHLESLSCPGIISMKVRDYEGWPIVIMPLADGDLEKYIGILGDKQAHQICKVIAKAFLCMYSNGDYYYDIKPANILFNCDGYGLSTIYLGDIGSIIKDDDDKYIGTYPPPDYPTGFIDGDTKDTLKHYTYQLSCLYCLLVSGVIPPPFGTMYYKIFQRLDALVKATMEKLGHGNKYTTVLKYVIKDKNLSRVPNLDKF